MNRKLIILGAALVVLNSITPAAFAAQEKGWKVRGEGIWVSPDVNFSQLDDEGDRVTASADGALGLGLGVEFRMSRHLGLDLGYQIASPEIDVRVTSGSSPALGITARDEIRFQPLTLALDIHLTPDRDFDLAIAPVFAWVSFGNLDLRARLGDTVVDTVHFSADDDLAIGGRLAVDFALGGGPWSLRASALYLQTDLVLTESGESERLDFDPFIISAGVSYRF